MRQIILKQDLIKTRQITLKSNSRDETNYTKQNLLTLTKMMIKIIVIKLNSLNEIISHSKK